jgi:hypothetical protein
MSMTAALAHILNRKHWRTPVVPQSSQRSLNVLSKRERAGLQGTTRARTPPTLDPIAQELSILAERVRAELQTLKRSNAARNKLPEAGEKPGGETAPQCGGVCRFEACSVVPML